MTLEARRIELELTSGQYDALASVVAAGDHDMVEMIEAGYLKQPTLNALRAGWSKIAAAWAERGIR